MNDTGQIGNDAVWVSSVPITAQGQVRADCLAFEPSEGHQANRYECDRLFFGEGVAHSRTTSASLY